MTKTASTREQAPPGLQDEFDGNPPLFADPKMENALVGAVLQDRSVIPSVKLIARGDDFADDEVGALYEWLIDADESGRATDDSRLMASMLKNSGLPPSVTNPSFLYRISIGSEASMPSSAVWYASEVRRFSLLRRQQGLAYDLLRKVKAPRADPEHIAAWMDARLDVAGRTTDTPVKTIAIAAGEVLDELDEYASRPRERGLFTGLVAVDEAIGGFAPGELVIIAARPGCGKTTLATQVALHNAKATRAGLFVSLEMTGNELASRQLCSIGRVNSRDVRSGNLDANDRQCLREAKKQLDGLPLRIWAPAAATIAQIRAVAKLEAAAPGGLRLLVVDYLGLVEADDRSRPRHEQVGRVSAGLKSLAKELGIPVIALCQLNREADGQPPRLSHLRESGGIEQDADVVLFLHPDEQHEHRVKLLVAKHRHCGTGSMDLNWVRSETRFVAPESF